MKTEQTTLFLVDEIKRAGEDFEWYPTTSEIISALCNDMPRYVYKNGHHTSVEVTSFLDIGAGNGKVLSAVKRVRPGVALYAIEKSSVLRAAMDDSIYIIGTEFYEQSLVDKCIDITFCNPPYSDFELWATKIIRESSSKYVYLVIPTRWSESSLIKDAVQYRDAKCKVLGQFSFSNAERQARAVVNLVRIELSKDDDDAFNREFSGIFPDLTEKTPGSDGETLRKSDEEYKGPFGHLVTGKNFVKSLVEMYRNDIEIIKKSYEAVGKLDSQVLKELGTNEQKVRELLRQRLKGLKNLYWKELVSRMEEITSRLIGKRRKKLIDQLNENGQVDFTESNVYAVVLWILKRANSVIDDQIIEVYEQFISKANVRNYKSNQKVYSEDQWRYRQEKPTHVYLDYRIIVEKWNSLDTQFTSAPYRMRYTDTLSDLITVAKNMGFDGSHADERLNEYAKVWMPGRPEIFSCIHQGKQETLFEVKAHLNGNIHIRLNQKFALALNVEYGRVKGWLHSKGQAADEIKDPKAAECFKSNARLLPSGCLMLCDNSDIEN